MFKDQLRKLRKIKGLSQYTLAEQVGLSRGQIANYEQGTREPDYETLVKIAEYFNTTTDYIFGKSNLRTAMLEVKDIEPESINVKENLQSMEKLLNQAVANGVAPKDAKDAIRYAEKLLSALHDAKKKGGNKK